MKYRFLLTAALLLLPASVRAAEKTEAQETQEIHSWSYLSLQSQFARISSFWNSYCSERLDCIGSDDSFRTLLLNTLGQSTFSSKFLDRLGEPGVPLNLSPASLQALAEQRAKLRAELAALREQAAARLGQSPEAIEAQLRAVQQVARDRMLQLSVKANMHTLQTIVETYGVDWGGMYPKNLTALQQEAAKPGREYWRDTENPYTGKSGLGGSLLEFSSYRPGDPAQRGMVLYQADPDLSNYRIFGVDAEGNLIQDDREPFSLRSY